MKYFFTSVNNRYISKASILAKSLKENYDDAFIFLVLSDVISRDIDYTVFDKVLTIEELEIPVASLQAWIFSHTVVELCTAVKPFAFKKIFHETNTDIIVYLDPDTVVYSPLDEMYGALATYPVILTPHVTVPAKDEDDLLDGELLGCLRHGVFNLGFLAIKNEGDGKKFLDWWASRCLNYCYDDGTRGLFTDQRWIDLAPCFFENIKILRHPNYNTATWNLYYREISKNNLGQIVVNSVYPLRFFHYSGFDIGTHESMLKKHAPTNVILREMSDSYIEQQEVFGQRRIGKIQSSYDFFLNGEAITREMRMLYREYSDIQKMFPKPYTDKGFLNWWKKKSDNTLYSLLHLKKVIGKINDISVVSAPLKRIIPNRFINILKRIAKNGIN